MILANHSRFAIALMLIAWDSVSATDSLRWFPEAPYAFVGVDYQLQSTNKNVSVFCNDGKSDTSNMGLGHVLLKNKQVEIVAQWTHHSCVTQANDWNVYDGVGVQARAYFW